MTDTISTAIISVIAILSSLATALILEKLKISTRMKEIQSFTNRINKEYFEALKRKDSKKLDELEPQLKQSQQMSFESVGLSLKSMAVVLPIAFGVPYLVRMLFPDFIITLPFQLPVPFRDPKELVVWRDTFGSYGWFWISFIFLGGLTQLIYNKIKEKNKKDEKDKKEEKN